MWRRLEVPYSFAGIKVQSNDGFGVEVVARPGPAIDDRLWIARSEVEHIELRIIGAGYPSHTATMGHCIGIRPGLGTRLSRLRNDGKMPLHFAGLRIARFQVTGDIQIVPTNAHDHVILDH